MSYTRDPRDYKYGMSGTDIVELQQKLVDAGHEIAVDGIFGEKTKRAVEDFEQDLGLIESMSFAVDRVTLEYLFHQDLCKPQPPKPNPCVPTGKGMFIRSWKHVGTPEEFKETLQQANIAWVCVLRLWQHADGDDNLTNETGANGHSREEFQEVLTSLDCDLWIWGWPLPGREEEFVMEMDDTASRWSACGIILDCEGEWYDHSADHLMTLSLETGHTIGLTSFGALWYHKSLPIKDFQRAEFGIPQIYESNGTWDQNFPEDSVAYWQERWPHVVPASSAFGSESHMKSLLRRTPVPDESLIFWDWYNASLQDYRWELVGSYSIDDD